MLCVGQAGGWADIAVERAAVNVDDRARSCAIYVSYELKKLITAEGPQCRGGFVHVPFAPEQALANSKP